MIQQIRSARALPLLLATALGCAALPGDPACPDVADATLVAVPAGGVKPSCAEARLDADELFEKAAAALQAADFELGYRYLALIHIQYPESDQSRDVFPLAARAFRKEYRRHRSELGSPWITTEPRFMFGWLGQFFEAQDAFPEPQVNALLVGMNYGLMREFLAFVKEQATDHPGLARWTLQVEEDDGIVESITAVRSDAASS